MSHNFAFILKHEQEHCECSSVDPGASCPWVFCNCLRAGDFVVWQSHACRASSRVLPSVSFCEFFRLLIRSSLKDYLKNRAGWLIHSPGAFCLLHFFAYSWYSATGLALRTRLGSSKWVDKADCDRMTWQGIQIGKERNFSRRFVRKLTWFSRLLNTHFRILWKRTTWKAFGSK